MRNSLLAFMLALLAGAAAVWAIQQGNGYVLISTASTSVEMGLWVAAGLYILVTLTAVWSLLTVRWLISAGGIRHWWASRRSARQLSKTAEGLLLYADQDWQKASALLAKSKDHSSMPMVNLMFAAQAAAENNDRARARQLLDQLKAGYPQAETEATKVLAELLIVEERFDEALRLVRPLQQDRPSDTGILRLLADIYVLQADWASAQKLLRDIKHYKALSIGAINELELDVYLGLVSAFQADPEHNQAEQLNQLSEVWELTPKLLRKNAELVASYADGLAQIKASEKLQPLLTKALNNSWHPALIERFGTLTMANPEKQLTIAEKWLSGHPEDADLLLALGRICARLDFKGKAKDYFNSSIKLNPCPQTYLELAELLESMGDKLGSERAYRLGLLAGLKE
jgi:HemY protein